ncbi:FGGY-family carbohydrate kinase [Labrys neptuniae]|uniref:FGGY-family carbohydrate kinase n=1 Tax=Labrys neptuniae TaxID=376174 RepID=UPI0028908915|nr:FGGY-family carbohydrate kinase [Labrys neptuniae]MDT3377231.1 FGGY-family carbohydrate kinase [Labrys neptuniae]
MGDQYFIGVDVGTGSARAGVFDASGKLLGSAKQAITIWHEPGDIVEQSSENIWQAVCASVKGALAEAAVEPGAIAGIGFDATCSLVVVGKQGEPLSVGPSDDPNRNVIVWMDHRSLDQTRRINETGEEVLRYVGGVISPEMETPKLLWLREHKPEIFASAGYFFDLPDYLSWRATGSLSRSVCTVTCKWTYLAHEKRWDAGYFHKIGLGALADEGFARIGDTIVDVGSPLGSGLTEAAAADLGLTAGIPVGASLIDAHAGGIGTVGAAGKDGQSADVTARLAYVFGTSACTMASTREAAFVPGVWGPYFSAMVPGLWLNEGGQSAAGAALDHLLTLHPAYAQAVERAETAGRPLLAWLEAQANLAGDATLARSIHVVPEFLGNRAPHADPDARAVIAGLDLEDDLDSLVRLYVAGLCGLAYGARQIVEVMAAKGIVLQQIIISGGAAQSPLVRQIIADATGIEVAVADTPEPVLLGAAMLGAVASKAYPALAEAMSGMSALGATYAPGQGEIRAFHEKKFKVYEALQAAGRQARELMA